MTKSELQIDGRKVVIRQAGQGPAVVVIPGLGLSGAFYDRSFGAFADAGLRLIVPDLPGFGGSRGGRTGLDVASTRAFVLQVADALSAGHAIWVGHSIGAQVAIDLAVHAPHRTRGLVLVGPTGRPGARKLPRQLWALMRESWLAPFPVVLRVAGDYLRTSPFAYLGTWIRYAHDEPLEKLRAVRAPALVLVGTRDPVVDALFLDILLRRLPDARLQRVAGGTHALPRAHAEQFHAAMLPFCRGLYRS